MKKIHVALASFGMSGRVFHGPLLKVNEGFIVKKIYERSKNESASMFPDSKIVRAYSQILSDPEIDLVVVNVPDKLHYSFAKDALIAGKHVVVEKPFVLDVDEGAELIDLAGKMGKVLTVFQNRRWDSDFLTVEKLLREGWLGEIKEVEAHFDRFKDTVQEGSWKEDPNDGASVLYNLGSHLVDQALVLFSMPHSVFADLAKVREGSHILDYFHIHLYYEGFKVILKSSYQVKEPGPKFMVHGTKGSFLKYGMDPQEEELKKGVLPTGPEWGKEPEETYGLLNAANGRRGFNGNFQSLYGNYPFFYQNLHDSLTGGNELAVKPHEALSVIKILKAAEKSNRESCVVKLQWK